MKIVCQCAYFHPIFSFTTYDLYKLYYELDTFIKYENAPSIAAFSKTATSMCDL